MPQWTPLFCCVPLPCGWAAQHGKYSEKWINKKMKHEHLSLAIIPTEFVPPRAALSLLRRASHRPVSVKWLDKWKQQVNVSKNRLTRSGVTSGVCIRFMILSWNSITKGSSEVSWGIGRLEYTIGSMASWDEGHLVCLFMRRTHGCVGARRWSRSECAEAPLRQGAHNKTLWGWTHAGAARARN